MSRLGPQQTVALSLHEYRQLFRTDFFCLVNLYIYEHVFNAKTSFVFFSSSPNDGKQL